MAISGRTNNGIMLAYDFFPSEGGIQTFMRSIAAADIGIHWTVLTRQAPGPLPLSMDPYDVVRTALRPQLRLRDRVWLKTFGRRATLPELIAHQTSAKLRSLGRQTKADFLFADQLCSAFSVRTAAHALGIPWGVGVYGKELLDLDQASRSLLADADLAVACSTFSKELAVKGGANPERTKVLHPAVDSQVYKPPVDRQAVRRHLDVDGRDVLVTVAHLVQRKGHELVIRALPAVKLAHPNVIYLVAGRGPHEEALRHLAASLGVSEAVRFCGYVPVQDLPLYYGAADIHIMPSTCDGDVEGFGISFIEAAACGTPSIGSRSGGIPDAIAEGQSGLLIEPGDVPALSRSILEMLNDQNAGGQMGLAARSWAETHFSGKVFAQALSNVFSQIQ